MRFLNFALVATSECASMGLSIPAVEFLCREHLREKIDGPVLTLGRQDIEPTSAELIQIIRSVGLDVEPSALEPSPLQLNDKQLFERIGLKELQSLDCSDYESADLIADLNEPVSEELNDRFRCIIDGGTCEHVFDVRQSLTNISKMLTVGGRVIHISPMNNFANHGFFQLSPTLFFDYYSANGFTDLRGYVAEQKQGLVGKTRWRLFEWDVHRGDHHLVSREQLIFLFVAKRTVESTSGAIPIQSWYRRQFESEPSSGTTVWRERWESLPRWLQNVVRKTVPGVDPARRPWWLKRAFSDSR